MKSNYCIPFGEKDDFRGTNRTESHKTCFSERWEFNIKFSPFDGGEKDS